MPTSHAALIAPVDLHEAKRLKQPVRAASTTNVTLTAPGASMDGVTLTSGDRVLLKDQTAASENGIRTWSGASSTLVRTADAAASSDFVQLFLVGVREGTANAGTYWIFTTTGAVTLGSTTLTFTKVGAAAGAIIDPTTTRGDLITRGVSAIVRLALGTAGQFLGSNGSDPLWTNSAQYFGATGLTGATAGTRLVGGTTSGAPISGTFAVGDFVVDQAGKVWVCTGPGTPGTWAQSGGGMANPMTTNQDMIVGGASGTPARLAVGANTQVLSIVNGIISWVNAASGFSNPMAQIGDMIYGGIAGAATRLAVGANGQVLTVVAGAPGWANPTGGGGGGTTNNTASSLYLANKYV